MTAPAQKNQDINYQPETKSFAYQNPENKNTSPKRNLNTFYILVLSILGPLSLVVLFLGILNYFNVFSLNLIPTQNIIKPSVTPDPMLIEAKKNNEASTAKPVFLPASNLWYGQGTLLNYKDSQIVVKIGKTIVNLQFSSENSTFYKSRASFDLSSSGSAVKINTIPYTLYELEQKENIGKNLQVFYSIDKSGKNTINTITLIN